MKQLPYNDYGSTMRRKFGGRIQKLSIDAGLSCPNRDGKIDTGGCTFCLGEAFSPSYCQHSNDIHQQIESALRFHATRGRRADSFIAYLQSGSNTYGDINTLERIYTKALSHPAISGLIIGTRPDCINSEILQLLEHLSHRAYIAVEYGIESVYDTTLHHVNRGHDFTTAVRTVAETKARGNRCRRTLHYRTTQRERERHHQWRATHQHTRHRLRKVPSAPNLPIHRHGARVARTSRAIYIQSII